MKKYLIPSVVLLGAMFVFISINANAQSGQLSRYQLTDISGRQLNDGDLISYWGIGDPDVYIIRFSDINPFFGYKRLFLNPVIFSFYGHLGGFDQVKKVGPEIRDWFKTTALFRNCETNDQQVWGIEVTGEDMGILHHVQMSGAQAASEDPYFFEKVFCINSNEESWYAKSIYPYTSLSQIPQYDRTVPTPTPPPPPGCYYEQVQCVTTPCDPVLVCDAPEITNINPERGTVGDPVTLYAKGAIGANTVHFGGVDIPGVYGVNSGDGLAMLGFAVPSLSPGSYPIAFTPTGSSTRSNVVAFTVVTPTPSTCTRLPLCAMPGANPQCEIALAPGTIVCSYPEPTNVTAYTSGSGTSAKLVVTISGNKPNPCYSLLEPDISVRFLEGIGNRIDISLPLDPPAQELLCSAVIQPFTTNVQLTSDQLSLGTGNTYTVYVNGYLSWTGPFGFD